MRDGKTWLPYVIVGFTLQVGVVWDIFSIGGINVSFYNLTAPVAVIAVALWMNFTFKFSRQFLVYLTLNIFLISTIVVTGDVGIPVRMLLAYGIALGLVVSLNFDASTDYYPMLFYGFVLGTLPIIALDIAAFVGVVPLNEASTVIPGMTKGGIGIIGISFGTHGTVASTGILGATGIIARYRQHFFQQRFVLVLFFVLFALIVASQSRSSMMAMVVGLAVIGTYGLRERFGQKLSAGAVAVTGLTIAVLGIQLAFYRLHTVVGRLSQLRAAYAVVTSNLVNGIGWGNFYPEYHTYVIHFTPANYFVSGGVSVGILFITVMLYPVWVFVQVGANTQRRLLFPVVVLLAMYAAVVVEIMFYKSTPNVHLLVLGGLITNSSSTVLQNYR